MTKEKTKALDHIQEWATRAFDAGATAKEVAAVIEDACEIHKRSLRIKAERDKLGAKLAKMGRGRFSQVQRAGGASMGMATNE